MVVTYPHALSKNYILIGIFLFLVITNGILISQLFKPKITVVDSTHHFSVTYRESKPFSDLLSLWNVWGKDAIIVDTRRRGTAKRIIVKLEKYNLDSPVYATKSTLVKGRNSIEGAYELSPDGTLTVKVFLLKQKNYSEEQLQINLNQAIFSTLYVATHEALTEKTIFYLSKKTFDMYKEELPFLIESKNKL